MGKLKSTEGWDAAREFARWKLGHYSWADLILAAYENPRSTLERLAADQGDFTDDAQRILDGMRSTATTDESGEA